jgi:hypothetical protein
MERRRLVFLNALPLNAINLQHFCIDVRRQSVDDVRYDVAKAKSTGSEIISYIRHEATLRLINELFGLNLSPNPGLYEWREGDEIIVITLRKPVRGQEVQQIDVNDLEFFYVYVSRECY